LTDISALSDPQEKGMQRKSLALSGLGRHKEALDLALEFARIFPDSPVAKEELERCKIRHVEQQTGFYDFKSLYKATKLRPPQLEFVSYRGPVEVRESKGRGRGLYTTKVVNAGDLIICEKAFSYRFPASEKEVRGGPSNSSLTTALIDVPQNKIDVGTHSDVIRDISTKVALNPSLYPAVRALCSGSYKDPPTKFSVDGVSVVDTQVSPFQSGLPLA